MEGWSSAFLTPPIDSSGSGHRADQGVELIDQDQFVIDLNKSTVDCGCGTRVDEELSIGRQGRLSKPADLFLVPRVTLEDLLDATLHISKGGHASPRSGSH